MSCCSSCGCIVCSVCGCTVDSCCQQRGGTMCCACSSPDAITTVTAATVAEMGFDSLVPLVGSTAESGPSVLFTFQIFPGRDWQYSAIDFDSPVNIPDDNVTIYYEDMNEVDPTDVIDWVEILDEILSDLGLDPLTPEEQAQPWEDTYDAYEDVLTGSGGGSTYTMEWDPSGMDSGDYSGGVTHSRWESEPSDPENDPPDDEEELDTTFTVEGTAAGALLIAFAPASIAFKIEPGETPAEKNFGIYRPAGDAPLYWKIAFNDDTGWPAGSGVTLKDGGAVIDPAVVQGPLLFDSIYYLSATLDSTGMLDNTVHTGTITLQGFTDAAGTDATNEVTLGVSVSVATVEKEFLVNVGDQERDVAFDIDIQCINKATREVIAAFTDTDLTLVLAATDGSDAMTPLTFDSTGLWVAGECTITARTITGGAGADAANTITVNSDTGVITGVSEEFDLGDSNILILTVPDFITRATAFNLNIDADNAGYTPSVAGVVLTTDDAADIFTVPVSGFVDNTGWVAGAKDIATTEIDGGAGTDIIRLTATDGVSGRTGFKDITLCPAGTMPPTITVTFTDVDGSGFSSPLTLTRVADMHYCLVLSPSSIAVCRFGYIYAVRWTFFWSNGHGGSDSWFSKTDAASVDGFAGVYSEEDDDTRWDAPVEVSL